MTTNSTTTSITHSLYTNYYQPLELTITVYKTPKEYASTGIFGDIPEEWWKNFAGINNGKSTAHVIKRPRKEMHFYMEEDCDYADMFGTIAHEIGHFQPKINIILHEENKADSYMNYANHVLMICDFVTAMYDVLNGKSKED